MEERTTPRPRALVTGASTGIGRELARVAAADGYDLVLAARREAPMRELAEELEREHGTRSDVLPTDLLDPEAVRELWRAATAQHPIDVLVNNAGVGYLGEFTEHSSEQVGAMINLNVVALTHLMHDAARAMRTHGSGRILNLASVSSFQPGPGFAVYHATKAYVLSLSDGVRHELRGTGVTVTTCCPGPVGTDFLATAGADSSSMLNFVTADATDIARSAWRATQRGRVLSVPGPLPKVLASGRVLPRWLNVRLAAHFLKNEG